VVFSLYFVKCQSNLEHDISNKNMMPFSLVGVYRRFGEICCLRLQEGNGLQTKQMQGILNERLEGDSTYLTSLTI
jgi:hypothetical protein